MHPNDKYLAPHKLHENAKKLKSIVDEEIKSLNSGFTESQITSYFADNEEFSDCPIINFTTSAQMEMLFCYSRPEKFESTHREMEFHFLVEKQMVQPLIEKIIALGLSCDKKDISYCLHTVDLVFSETPDYSKEECFFWLNRPFWYVK